MNLILQLSAIFGYFITICGFIRLLKFFLFIQNKSVFKQWVCEFKTAIIIALNGFILVQIIEVLDLIFELDKDFPHFRQWYWYLKDFAYIASCGILIRYFFYLFKTKIKWVKV